MSRPEPSANDSPSLCPSDLTRLLQQHVQTGFPPDLALDLVLNELVVRAADATHASAAALALARGDEMVCRAATGVHAPDLGIPLNTRDGLSGTCVRSRLPQLSADTESDPRVDSAISRRLGIRSMLIVPVFDAVLDPMSNGATDGPAAEGHKDWQSVRGKGNVSEIRQPQLAGVLEVFSPLPNAFSQSAQSVLEEFACECARICQAAAHVRARPPAELVAPEEELVAPDTEPIPAGAEIIPLDGELVLPASIADAPPARPRQPYEVWTLVLGALVICAAAAFSFLIGTRIGWLRPPQPVLSGQSSPSDLSPPAALPRSTVKTHNQNLPQTKPSPQPGAKSTNAAPDGSADGLVVYDKGKVVFRIKPSPLVEGRAALRQAQGELSAAPRSPHAVWLAPAQAESRLVSRVEPQYPTEALAAHRSGNVTLEVQVAEDGTVSSVRTLSGDPLLAAAAAQAVRNWRYQPYRPHEQPSTFQTDVTLTFSLPN